VATTTLDFLHRYVRDRKDGITPLRKAVAASVDGRLEVEGAK